MDGPRTQTLPQPLPRLLLPPTHSLRVCSGPSNKLGSLLIGVRKLKPPIFPEHAFFLKQGIDFQQDTQASKKATYVNLYKTLLICCWGHLSPWLGRSGWWWWWRNGYGGLSNQRDVPRQGCEQACVGGRPTRLVYSTAHLAPDLSLSSHKLAM